MNTQKINPTVYIGNLPFDMTEEEIETEFGKVAEVVNVKIAQKRGRPAGYAFVEMKNMGGAKRVVDKLDGTEVSGRTIRSFVPYPRYSQFSSFSPTRKPQHFGIRRRQPINPKEESTTQIHVSNIPFNMKDEEFEKIFQNFKTKECKISRKKDGRSKGFGFVEFESHEDQKKALKLNGKEFNGRKIEVKIALVSPPKEESTTQIHVSNIPFNMKDEEFAKIFQNFKTKECKISRKKDGRSKGFGFVEFESNEDQQKALELNGKEFNGRKIGVRVAYLSKQRKFSKTRIYVSNLPFDMKDKGFEEIFQNFKTKECKIVRYGTGKSKGFGFVEFESHEDQQKSLELNGKEFGGRKIGVRVAYLPNQREFSKTQIYKRNGRSKGFGFVEFESNEYQQKSLELNGKEFGGRKIGVRVAYVPNQRELKYKIVRLRNGRSKGYGFVEFESNEDQQKSLELNDKEFNGRQIRVKIACESHKKVSN
ncbi:nucleic acid binding protein [Anaeramoeba ignava]|uniref:Nucleic acid binding protein n=1 Tax=Anaeramoeba ignava TaxID=1746090 RepID=A0A9Q0RD67_ANAIG|nr:nucleic acid binding protein [Anaeramoeba ignava]